LSRCGARFDFGAMIGGVDSKSGEFDSHRPSSYDWCASALESSCRRVADCAPRLICSE
jgi:hypothetical protein